MEQEVTFQTSEIDYLNDKKNQDEIQTCKRFLIDSEFEKARLKVFNYAIEALSTKNGLEKFNHASKK